MNRQLFNAMVAQYGKETVVSGGSTNDTIEWSGGVHCALPSLKFYGLSEQYGTPTPDSPLGVYGFTGPFEVLDVIYTNTPPLHGIKNYKDEWDYITGKGLRKVAVVTLDGITQNRRIEAVVQHTSSGYYYAILGLDYESVEFPIAPLMSTHFKGATGIYPGRLYATYNAQMIVKSVVITHTDQTLDTPKKWNAWLKEQYDAGTPVTVYYALAEPIPFEERPDYAPYQAIPNESGRANIIDGGMDTPFEVSYIKHS